MRAFSWNYGATKFWDVTLLGLPETTPLIVDADILDRRTDA
ncbi:MAG: hypothetical protein U9N84_00310 [Actinomycetota bacterium]|nr:hypothetical protein [Actinomycetota bacterium]